MSDRKALVTFWQERLRGARLRLESAQTSLHEFLKDNPVNTLSTADGHYGYRQAVKEERFALEEYARIQRIYQNLTVYGIIPDEDAFGKEAGKGE
jgi:hypothetical protein